MNTSTTKSSKTLPSGLPWSEHEIVSASRLTSPAEFARTVTGGTFTKPPHIAYLSKLISDAVWNGNGRLIVTMPPRHGKSETGSHWTPAWFLELWPGKRVILASYEADFAESWGRKVRNTIEQHPDDFSVRVAQDSSAARRWDTTVGGGMQTAGVGGPITGKGADLLIIDDPVKNAEEANSETMREKAWDWWRQVARTRLEPKGTAVIIMTRWHEDDLVGRMLEVDETNRWTVVNFPAIAEESDILGREEGEALWPARYDEEALADICAGPDGVGAYAWSSLYQQRPSPAGGAIFQRQHFRYFIEHEHHFELLQPDGVRRKIHKDACWLFQVADTAQKAKTTSDWTVCLTAAVGPESELLILDVARARLEVPEQWPFLLTQRARHPTIRWQACEDKASGIFLVQLAARQGIPLRPLAAVGDKVDRASPASVMYEVGRVYHRQSSPWLEPFESELCSFPVGTYDDQVDCVSYAARALIENASIGRAPIVRKRRPKGEDPDEEEYREEARRAKQVKLRRPRRKSFEEHVDALRDRSR